MAFCTSSFLERKRFVKIRAVAFVIAVVVLAASIFSCGEVKDRIDRKMIVIGFDGMDWKLIDSLIEQGELENFSALKNGGAWGNLLSLVPLEKSPVIWTTISSGRAPDEHGVEDYVTNDKQQRPFTSNALGVRPMWEILGAAGNEVAIVNWMVTWPAYPVNGILVTNYFVYDPRDGYNAIADLTYPPEFEEEILDLRSARTETPDEEIAFHVNEGWNDPADYNIPIMMASLKELYSSDKTTLEVTHHILTNYPELDFYAFYFQGTDLVSHRYWGQMDPSSLGKSAKPSEKEIQVFGETVLKYYMFADEILGQIMSYVDKERDTIIMCSDHGFRGPYIDRAGLHFGISMHRPEGVVILYGKDINPGSRIKGATVFDIAPTVLTLYGLPVSREMQGHPIRRAISEEFLSKHPINYIDTYEAEEKKPGRPVASPIDDALRERLRALGYID